MRKIKFLPTLLLMLAVVMMASCSEATTAEEEYPDWQVTNESYFDKLYTATKAKIDAGDTSWKIIRSWTLDSTLATHSYDHIIVHVESEGNSTVRAYTNDSVRVHYKGRLIPSKSYTSGYVFDKSYTGTFNAISSTPSEGVVSGYVNGFTTAILNMHLGDSWEVYIPYQLGYGTTEKSTIPAYSTLIFNVNLVGIYRSGSEMPEWNAKFNEWIEWEE